jgi:tetraacyldisaccharide 4'-kinase
MLRESPKAATRAHLVGGFTEAWGDCPSDFTFAYEPTGLLGMNRSLLPLDAAPRKVHLLTGIARPERFCRTVADLGFTCVSLSVFQDHHRFSSAELRLVFSQAAKNGADALLTTEKDLVRISSASYPLPIFALRVEVRLCTGELRLSEAMNGVF